MQLGLGAAVAMLIWPLAALDTADDPVETSVAGETLERLDTLPPLGIPTTTATTSAPAKTTDTTRPRTDPASETDSDDPPEKKPREPRPSTTTSTAPPPTTTSTTTTTTPKPPPRPPAIIAQSTSEVFGGVQLTLNASPPASGAARTAGFRLDVEFGDARVLRGARFAFGDGTTVDAPVIPWSCFDPAAPNPYLLAGPSHVFATAGTFPVTVTVRTVTCVEGQAEGPAETVQLRLDLVVP